MPLYHLKTTYSCLQEQIPNMIIFKNAVRFRLSLKDKETATSPMFRKY